MSWLGRLLGGRGPDELSRLREHRERLEARVEARRVQFLERVSESWDWQDRLAFPFGDPDRLSPDNFAYPYTALGTLNDRRHGNNYPVFRNEIELQNIRGLARLLCQTNKYAIGVLENLKNYVVGKGFGVQAVSKDRSKPDSQDDPGTKGLVREAQACWDEFVAADSVTDGCFRLGWDHRFQELFLRSRRDGEVFLRTFRSAGGVPKVRFVEPEQVGNPPGVAESAEWSYGVHKDPEDAEAVTGYWVKDPNGDNLEDQEVPAEDLLHLKLNVDSAVARGLSDFFPAREDLDGAGRLLRNIREGATLQAAIAWVRQHDSATQPQVTDLRAALADYTKPAVPNPARQVNVAAYEPGTIVDINKGVNYVPPPGAANVDAHLNALQAVLRGCAVRWCAPEFVVSADASNNNFASILVAGSPFVLAAESSQTVYAGAVRWLFRRVLRYAVDAGRLAPEALDLVEAQVTPPAVALRNRVEDAQVNQIENQARVLSPQTWAQKSGLDPQEEQANWERWRERNGDEARPMPVPGEPPPEKPGY